MKHNGLCSIYRFLFDRNEIDLLSDFIDTLSHEDRISLRKELKQFNIAELRNLYYDYDGQKWITSDDFPW